MKEKKRKSTIQLAIWTWTWVASLALASFGPRFIWDENPIITTIAIIINVTMGVMMIIANRNFFNHSDELERKIQMESMAVTLGLTVVVGLAYSLLEQTKLINHKAEISILLFLMSFTLITALYVNRRRYQ